MVVVSAWLAACSPRASDPSDTSGSASAETPSGDGACRIERKGPQEIVLHMPFEVCSLNPPIVDEHTIAIAVDGQTVQSGVPHDIESDRTNHVVEVTIDDVVARRCEVSREPSDTLGMDFPLSHGDCVSGLDPRRPRLNPKIVLRPSFLQGVPRDAG